MRIELAQKEDIPDIINILKERCNWLKENNIDQWGEYYYKEKYNANYFYETMKFNKLYVVKQGNKVVGVFLLKEEDKDYWYNEDDAYYIHHLATKVGYSGLGKKIISFVEKLAKQNSVKYLRLDCKKNNEKLNNYYKNQGFIYKGTGEEPYSYNLWEKEIL